MENIAQMENTFQLEIVVRRSASPQHGDRRLGHPLLRHGFHCALDLLFPITCLRAGPTSIRGLGADALVAGADVLHQELRGRVPIRMMHAVHRSFSAR